MSGLDGLDNQNSAMPPTTVLQADYQNPRHAADLIDLLDAYASDPAGGGEGLTLECKAGLVAALAVRPQAYSVLAYRGEEAVGLVNCIEGFSTFACRPLVNVHDVAVMARHRGQGIAAQMLALAEALARQRGAAKLTLEVLSGNHGALSLYHRLGFAAYQLAPSMGSAQFMQKWLI